MNKPCDIRCACFSGAHWRWIHASKSNLIASILKVFPVSYKCISWVDHDFPGCEKTFTVTSGTSFIWVSEFSKVIKDLLYMGNMCQLFLLKENRGHLNFRNFAPEISDFHIPVFLEIWIMFPKQFLIHGRSGSIEFCRNVNCPVRVECKPTLEHNYRIW